VDTWARAPPPDHLAARLGGHHHARMRMHRMWQPIRTPVAGEDTPAPPVRGHAALALPWLRRPVPAHQRRERV